MSSQDCRDQAAICDTQAKRHKDAPEAAHWAEMARQWRLLAGDGDSSETLARLMRDAKPSRQF